MAKFVFKMQSVLTVKEKLEDQAKQNYGAMLHLLQQEQEELTKQDYFHTTKTNDG